MIITVVRGCPLCNGDVKGNREAKFYCKLCNILFIEIELNRKGKFVGRLVPGSPFLASYESKVYHTGKCHLVKNISKNNLIYFCDKKETRQYGYRKCKLCQPK
ncbi:MAG: hypothetical protein ABIG95_03255 [Candidatus Woesearchaeota archaeon]